MIDDEPVNLNEIDLLGNIKYSEQLKESILNSSKNKSITIGLFGEWGSGKSSIVETARIDLESSYSDIKFITYDAWKYTNDGFRRTFLMQVRNVLKSKAISKQELQNRLYSGVSKKKYSKLILVFLFFALLIVIFQWFGQSIETSIFYSFSISFPILILTTVIQILSNFISSMSIQKNHYFSPEQFENDFDTILNEAINKSLIKKIVIVIDNLDRCSESQTYDTLTDVRGFLDNKDLPIIFLMPLDDNSLSSQIQKYGDKPSEFIRKIFDVVIHIKPFKESMYDSVNSINESKKLGLKADTIYLIAEEYATNIRKIKRLLSNLQEELSFFDKCHSANDNVLFSKKYETIICKLLILREEWPEFYHEVAKNPKLLNKKTEPLLDFYWADKELEIETEKRKNRRERELIMFLENTKAITKKIDDELIRKLTTSHNFFEAIPNEIITQLKEKQYDKIFIYIENDANFSLLFNYLIKELKLGLQRNALETKIPEIFDHLLKINSKRSIQTYDIILENMVGEHSVLVGFFTSLNELEYLVKYTWEHKIRNPDSYLFEFITYELNVTPERNQYFDGAYYVDLFLTFVEKYPDSSICDMIKDGFAYRFEKIVGYDYDLKNGSKIDEEKIKHLITDELIDKLLNQIEHDAVKNNLIYISSFHKLNAGHIRKIDDYFAKLCDFKEEVDFEKDNFTTPSNFSQRLSNFRSFVEDVNKNLDLKNQIDFSMGRAYALHHNSKRIHIEQRKIK
jgi:KAP family P-loop domain.